MRTVRTIAASGLLAAAAAALTARTVAVRLRSGSSTFEFPVTIQADKP